MLDAALILALAAVLAGSARLLHRIGTPAGFWLAGWIAAALAGVLLLVVPGAREATIASFPLATWFAWMLLAGALALAGRRPPPALYAAALALGVTRAALAAVGRVDAAHAVSLATEPFVVLAAAWVCHRSLPAGAPLVRRWLAPSFLVLTAAGAAHVVLLGANAMVPPLALVAFWLTFGPAMLGYHLHVVSDLGRRELRLARKDLERRVAERTEELERANRSLRGEVERHRATAERLRGSEERYRAVSELSSDFSFALRVHPDVGIRREWVTGAFERITGFPPETLDGWDWIEMLGTDEREETREWVASARGRGRARTVERHVATASGEPRWLRVEVVSLRDAEDGTVRVLGAARDVTEARLGEIERSRLAQLMEDAQRLESLGMLTGGIAHDFNNLLAVVLGNTAILLDDLQDDEHANHRLRRVRAAAEHAARLTEQMLTYSGKTAVSLEPCDVSELVRGTGDLLAASVAEGCELVTHLSSDAVVHGDPTRLRQVVLNLVTNASEALGSERGRVAIHTGLVEADAADLRSCLGADDLEPGRYVALDVTDDGCGMDDDTRRRVFEPFFTTKFSGRGLGLASVLGIVRAHGGGIRVESRPGEGTRVRVLMPAGQGKVAAAPAPAPAAGGAGRVLVIDDDADVLELAQEFLERAGHDAVVALGGREGIETFRKRSAEIDTVVLDLSMPDVGGEDVFLALREVREDVPVVLATGYSEELAAERFRARGIVSLLRKPYSLEELAGAVRAARELAQSPGSPPADPGRDPR